MRRSFLTGTLGATATVAVVMACGGGDGLSVFEGAGGSSANGSGAANSGGSGNITLTGGNGGSSAGGNSGGAGGDACAAESYTGERIPIDMFIMMDKSGSMSGQNGQNGGRNVWIPITGAIKQFVQSTASDGIGIGLGYFPIQASSCPSNNPQVCDCTTIDDNCSSCTLSDYSTPDVPIALLPGAANQIVQSLDANGPGGATPTRPALEGALQYARAHMSANAGRRAVVVLATDGRPNDCSSNVNNVSAVARAEFQADPSISTFVIGIGNTGNLNDIAQAGGTDEALIVDSANAGDDFLDAMNAIRGQVLTCEFGMPTPGGGQTVDPNQVNVRFTPEGGPQGDRIFKVDNAAACDGQTGGWYYDDNANPTRIFLCEATCDNIRATPGRIDLELRCPSVIGPPA